jgi:hypothetical protein
MAAGGPSALRWLAAGFVIPVTYLAGITAAGTGLARGLPAAVRVRVPVVLGVMHMCWGSGFLTSPRTLHRSGGRQTDAGVGQPGATGERTAAAGRE